MRRTLPAVAFVALAVTACGGEPGRGTRVVVSSCSGAHDGFSGADHGGTARAVGVRHGLGYRREERRRFQPGRAKGSLERMR